MRGLPRSTLSLIQYLSGGFAFVVVVCAGGGIDVLVNAVQEPQQEFQRVVLGISPELRAIFGHNALDGRKQGKWSPGLINVLLHLK